MRMTKPYEHRNLFDNINLFMDVHKFSSVSIWTPKKKARNEYIKWLAQSVKEIIGCPVYVISSNPERYNDIKGVTITNNAPKNTLALTIGIHSVKDIDTCNLKYQWCLIDIQKNKGKKKGFGVISYLISEDYEDWLKGQIKEYAKEKHHITKEELFKDCPYLEIPAENLDMI